MAPTSKPSSPTPAGRPGSAETTYAQSMIEAISTVGRALKAIGEMAKEPRLFTDAWKVRVKAQAEIIKTSSRKIIETTSPASMQKVHGSLADAARDCNAAAEKLQQALDTMNVELLKDAIKSGASCGAKFGQLSASLYPSGTSTTGGPQMASAANVRAGPGSNYARIGGVLKGAPVTVIGRDSGGDWLAISTPMISRGWVARILVEGAPPLDTLPVLAQ